MLVRLLRPWRHILFPSPLTLLQQLKLFLRLLHRQGFLKDGIIQEEQRFSIGWTHVEDSLQVLRGSIHLCLRERRDAHHILQNSLLGFPATDGVQPPAGRYREFQQSDLLTHFEQLSGDALTLLLVAAVDVVREGRTRMAAPLQHAVGQQVVIVKLRLLRLLLLVASAALGEVSAVVGRVAQGQIVLAVGNAAGTFVPIRVDIDVVYHPLPRCLRNLIAASIDSLMRMSGKFITPSSSIESTK